MNRPLLWLALAGLSFAACSGVQASSARYHCEGGLVLQADLTPRAGRVLAGQTWWAVKRLREPAVRYRDDKKIVTLAMMGRRATWQEGNGPVLNCELVQPDFPHKF
ncbi:MAG: hypothetical protein C4K60_14175 [Ideonella sp. MAG2]|nr:MAG: hypothetical protein C4K60_14175 [Ideonella sp. MAG2]